MVDFNARVKEGLELFSQNYIKYKLQDSFCLFFKPTDSFILAFIINIKIAETEIRVLDRF